MSLFTHRRVIKLTIAAITAAAITLLTGLGLFRWFDNRVADALFQRQELTSGKVIVIGIDEKALQEYGPFQSWNRSIMAQALEQLASDSERQPAVVAVDTLYSGLRGDASDERLAEAAGKLPCVVTGARLLLEPPDSTTNPASMSSMTMPLPPMRSPMMP